MSHQAAFSEVIPENPRGCRSNPSRAFTVPPPRPPGATTARLVLPAPAQDPHVLAENGFYYYCESSPSGIWVRATRDFLDVGATARARVWTPPRRGLCSRNLWAPELHRIAGRCYIYFAADDGDNARHRMWVLAATTDDPAGPYELAGPLETQGWAIDGTPFTNAQGERFFIWSGWPGATDGQQHLYIAPMRDALTLAGPRHLIATPDEPWERHGLPLCEGPQILQRGGRTFLIYSASGSWTADYCLGAFELVGRDPTDPRSWRKLGRVFEKNRHAWGVGHCSFATSSDGVDWLLYHAKTSRRDGWSDREVRAQPFDWHLDGTPCFGAPLPTGRRLARPPRHSRIAVLPPAFSA